MRAQFTFYRSFWDAIKELPAKDRTALLSAICEYALDGKEPTLTGIQRSIFTLIKPTLDTSARKADSGRLGGSKREANGKQTGSKPEANAKQTAREKEREVEKEGEREIEIENECSPPIAPKGAFDVFWAEYPKKVGKEAARKAFAKVKVPIETLTAAIQRQKGSDQWTRDNGQYIPNPATWLNQGRWEDELTPSATKVSLDYGDRSANIERMRKMLEDAE